MSSRATTLDEIKLTNPSPVPRDRDYKAGAGFRASRRRRLGRPDIKTISILEFTEFILFLGKLAKVSITDVKLLINGANCCGKTTFGNWLQDSHGYKHIDFEDGNGNVHRTNIREGLMGATPAPWADRVVVTWAFPPNAHNFSIVRELVSFGFAIWWFDGDLGRARERYIARSGLPNTIRDFDSQTIRLAEAQEEIARIYAGRMITTLTSSGCLSCPEILAIVSAAAPVDS